MNFAKRQANTNGAKYSPSTSEWVYLERKRLKAVAQRRRKALDTKAALRTGLEPNPGPRVPPGPWIRRLLAYLRACACDTSCPFVRRRTPISALPIELECVRRGLDHMRTLHRRGSGTIVLQFIVHGWCETYMCIPARLQCDAEVKRKLLILAGIEPNPGPQDPPSTAPKYVRLEDEPRKKKKNVHHPGDYTHAPGPACPYDSRTMQGVKQGRLYVCPICRVTIVKGEHPSKGLLLDQAEAQSRGLTVAQLQDCEAFLSSKPENVHVSRPDGTKYKTRSGGKWDGQHYRPLPEQEPDGYVAADVLPSEPVPPKPLAADQVGNCHAVPCQDGPAAAPAPVIEVAGPAPNGAIAAPACEGGSTGTIAELTPRECPKAVDCPQEGGQAPAKQGVLAPASVPGPVVGAQSPVGVPPGPANLPLPVPPAAGPAGPSEPASPNGPAAPPGSSPEDPDDPTAGGPFNSCFGRPSILAPQVARLKTMKDPAHSGLVFSNLNRDRFYVEADIVRWAPEVREVNGQRKENDARLPGLRGAQVVPGAYHTQRVRRGKQAPWTWRVAAYPVAVCSIMFIMGLVSHVARCHLGRVDPGVNIAESLFLFSTVASVGALCYLVRRIVCCVMYPLEYTEFHHVPSISAMMVLQNMASCREDFEKNLPTLFLRHAGSLNIPSSHIPLLQEGCIAAALLNYDILLDEKEHPQDFRATLRPTEGYSFRPVE